MALPWWQHHKHCLGIIIIIIIKYKYKYNLNSTAYKLSRALTIFYAKIFKENSINRACLSIRFGLAATRWLDPRHARLVPGWVTFYTATFFQGGGGASPRIYAHDATPG